jgi:hypothetical protein
MTRLGLLFVIFATLVGCSNDLTRNQAEKMIRDQNQLWETKFWESKDHGASVLECDMMAANLTDWNYRTSSCPADNNLMQAGYIKAIKVFAKDQIDKGTGERYYNDIYKVEVLEKMRPFIMKSEEISENYSVYPTNKPILYAHNVNTQCVRHYVKIPLWTPKFKEIKGVRDTRKGGEPGCDAVVDYIMEMSFSDLGALSSNRPPALETKKVCFVLHDDGWKIRNP